MPQKIHQYLHIRVPEVITSPEEHEMIVRLGFTKVGPDSYLHKTNRYKIMAVASMPREPAILHLFKYQWVGKAKHPFIVDLGPAWQYILFANIK